MDEGEGDADLGRTEGDAVDVGEAAMDLLLVVFTERGLITVRGVSAGPPFFCVDANAIALDHNPTSQFFFSDYNSMAHPLSIQMPGLNRRLKDNKRKMELPMEWPELPLS